jgi:protein-disulfide isomerase
VITRRVFLQGASALTIGAVFAGGLPFDGLRSALEAQAQAQPPAAGDVTAELMKPAGLPDQVQGSADAPVTIVEYASATCSHCATFHTTTYPTLKSRYIDTGKVKYILREFPLDPLAAGAFLLARCAEGGKYYPIVDALFQQQKDWAFVQKPIPALLKIAKQFGFTDQSFEQCLSNQKLLDNLEEVRQRGQTLGVNSTPTFFINGKIFRGTLTVQELEKQLQPLLKS